MSQKGNRTFLGILGRHGEEFVVLVGGLEKLSWYIPQIRICASSRSWSELSHCSRDAHQKNM